MMQFLARALAAAAMLLACSVAGAAPAAFKMVAAGSAHLAALDAEGGLWVWGDNTFGQLGLGDDNEIAALAGGTPINRSHPVRLDGGYIFVSAGSTYTLAIRDDGSVWGWGSNVPGLDAEIFYRRPALVTRRPMQKIHAGHLFALALDRDGTMWQLGRLGEERRRADSSPMYMGRGVREIAMQSEHAAMLYDDGTAWTFGTKNDDGRLGRPVTGYRQSGQVGGDDHVAASAGASYTQFRRADGSSVFYGDMAYLKPFLGKPVMERKDLLVAVTPYVNIRNFQKNHWGLISVYLLKDNGDLDEVKVSFKDGVAQAQAPATIAQGMQAVAGDNDVFLGLKRDGSLWVWGRSDKGLLGAGEQVKVAALPVPVKFQARDGGGVDEKN